VSAASQTSSATTRDGSRPTTGAPGVATRDAGRATDGTARYSRILGVGSYLPGEAVTNAELVERLRARGIETSDEWIVARTGIRQRYLAEPDVGTSALGIKASRAALAHAGLDAADIDLIICATSTPDQIFPSTACLIQRELGNFGGPAFDVQAVCSGFIYALATADSMIRTGLAQRALV